MTTSVKICGLTDEQGLDTALAGGADYAGLVFFAKSPRHLSMDRAVALRERVPRNGQCKVVALMVDPSDVELTEVIGRVDPDYIQLHGHEAVERVAAIRNRFHKPILKAVPVLRATDVQNGRAYFDPGRLADILLFDARPDPDATLPGGNGVAFDWQIFEGLGELPPFALAGGLTVENVAGAIACTGAAIVDVSSGVESAPGRKDPELIRRFLRNAKAAKQDLNATPSGV